MAEPAPPASDRSMDRAGEQDRMYARVDRALAKPANRETVVSRYSDSIASSDGHPSLSEEAEAAVQLLAALLAFRSGAGDRYGRAPKSMLTVAQTAALLGVSRMTIIRKADAGELPCVVVSRGKHQKLRRFPRALIENLAFGGGCDA